MAKQYIFKGPYGKVYLSSTGPGCKADLRAASKYFRQMAKDAAAHLKAKRERHEQRKQAEAEPSDSPDVSKTVRAD